MLAPSIMRSTEGNLAGSQQDSYCIICNLLEVCTAFVKASKGVADEDFSIWL